VGVQLHTCQGCLVAKAKPSWILGALSLEKGGSISIRLNDENSRCFQHGKGTVSPLLSNLEVDVFIRILVKAATRGYITRFMDSVCYQLTI
jgi:hypothetical protein